ncbi:hypothetical protein PTI98_006834 [Pleurotus ostreatus]|nr:hypothetical protein PTI98_006834 [Pleurotus ostreatus]
MGSTHQSLNVSAFSHHNHLIRNPPNNSKYTLGYISAIDIEPQYTPMLYYSQTSPSRLGGMILFPFHFVDMTHVLESRFHVSVTQSFEQDSDARTCSNRLIFVPSEP